MRTAAMTAGEALDPPRARPESADQAVERLYREHRLQLVRLAYLLVGDRESAEDIAQDAFAGLHRHWQRLRSPDAAAGYLRTATVNGARSMLRRRRTTRRFPQPDESALTTESAEATSLLSAEHAEVLAALRRLPDRQREVLLLRYWSELGEAEIARTLGISVGAVKSNASRGRAALATMLGQDR
ncbi:MAG TPA: SigE family RNA polymerase sigma factor [Jatrophihabitans sp.]|nr:SigE family RNA polymerase sigma factor [Jatrophihabitans sp.]